VGAINPLFLSFLSQSAISALDDYAVSGFTSSQLMQMSASQISALNPSAVSQISISALQALNPELVGQLSGQFFNALASEQISALSKSQVRSLSTNELQSLSVAAIAALLASNGSELSTDQISSFSTGQLASISPAELQLLSGDQFAGLSLDQLINLTDSQFAVLTAEQVNNIDIGRLSQIGSNQAFLLSSSAISAADSQHADAIRLAQSGGTVVVQQGDMARGTLYFQIPNGSTAQTFTITNTSPYLTFFEDPPSQGTGGFTVFAQAVAPVGSYAAHAQMGWIANDQIPPSGSVTTDFTVTVTARTSPPPPPPVTKPCYFVDMPKEIQSIIAGDTKLQGLLASITRSGVSIKWDYKTVAVSNALAVTYQNSANAFNIVIANDIDDQIKALAPQFVQDKAQVVFHELDHVRLEAVLQSRNNAALYAPTSNSTIEFGGHTFSYNVNGNGWAGLEHVFVHNDLVSIYGSDKTGSNILIFQQSDQNLKYFTSSNVVGEAYGFAKTNAATAVVIPKGAPQILTLSLADISNLSCPDPLTTKDVTPPIVDTAHSTWVYLNYTPQVLVNGITPSSAQLSVADVRYTATASPTDGLSIQGNLKLTFGGTSDGNWVSLYRIFYYGNDPTNPGQLQPIADLSSSDVQFGPDGFATLSFTANGLYQHSGVPSFSYGFELRAVGGDGKYLTVELPSATQGNGITTGP